MAIEMPFSSLLRVPPGTPLTELDTRATPGVKNRARAAQKTTELQARIAGLQERLYAEAHGGRDGAGRSLLLIVQGMDTSGKGGVMRHVVGACDPQGVRLTAFKAPTEEERAHPFLWRIRNALPHPGQIGVFDRSQYEDVLIVRVHELVPRAVWSRRYAQINRFEQQVAASGTTIVKVMLRISPEEQRARLSERLTRPDKYWKYNPQDVDERLRWREYEAAYQAVVDRCQTEHAPWHVVPADRKWYVRYAVTRLLAEHLQAIDPQWPPAAFDVKAERRRLAAADV